MQNNDLLAICHRYLDCLNRQDWDYLGKYVADNVSYNGQFIGFAGYLNARQNEFRAIPDLHFNVQLVMANESMVACRLNFNITPSHDFLGLSVHGKLISFSENVFYEFDNGKISKVWSVVDKAAIEVQLSQ